MPNILGVPQEEKALLRAFQERRKKLQLEAMQMAFKAAEDARTNYGKLQLDPSIVHQDQTHSLLGPNPRLSFDNVYDTSSEQERTALALEILGKAVSGGQAGYGKPPIIATNKNPMAIIEERLRYGSPEVYDEAVGKLRAGAGSQADQVNIENFLRSSRFGRPIRK